MKVFLFVLYIENQRIHNSVISWMVHLLVKTGRPDLDQSDNIDHEFQLLNHEVKHTTDLEIGQHI
jgi:hypothetical protein